MNDGSLAAQTKRNQTWELSESLTDDGKSGFAVYSLPGFNKPHKEFVPKAPHVFVNATFYGPVGYDAIDRCILSNTEFKEFYNAHGISKPGWQVVDFVIDNALKKLPILVKDLNSNGAAPIAERITKFGEHMKLLLDNSNVKKSIKTFSDWQQFVWASNQVTNLNWLKLQDFNDVMQCFGMTTNDAKGVADWDCVRPGKDTEKHAQVTLRWLSKLMTAWSFNGCLVDLVNFVCWMQGLTGKVSLNTALNAINEFGLCLSTNMKFKWGNFPTHVIHDCELDDIFTWMLIKFMANRSCREVTGHVQTYPLIAKRKAFKDLNTQMECNLIEENDPSNMKALDKLFSTDFISNVKVV